MPPPLARFSPRRGGPFALEIALRTPARTSRPSLEQQLDSQVDALDRLMSGVRGGIRGPAHYDALEQEWDDICRAGRAAFRECRH